MTIPSADEALSAAEKIKKAAERTREALQDQKMNGPTKCAAALAGAPPPHQGDCAHCAADGKGTQSHSLPRTTEAEKEAERFYKELRAAGKLGDVPISDLDDKKGNMIGVLLCVDENGNTQVLRAFSGSIDSSGKFDAPDCSPMIPPNDPASFAKNVADKKEVDQKIEAAEKTLVAKEEALREAKAKVQDDIDKKQTSITAIYKDKSIKDKKVAAAQLLADKALLEATCQKEELEAKAARDEVAKLEEQSEQLSNNITNATTIDRPVTNFAGDTKSTLDATTDKTKATDGRTGNCAAPKMIAEAQKKGWTPVSLAEVWIGKEQGKQKDFAGGGGFVPSCECCQSILGHMLHGLPEKQEARAKELETAAPASTI